MRNFIIIFFVCCAAFATNAQVKVSKAPKAKINWMSLEQAYEANQKEPRKAIVDVYTSWCGWCKVMDQKTFTDERVIDYINQKFYAIKLDAETKDTIKIGTQKYVWMEENGYNQAGVALAISEGRISFPTISYLDESFKLITPIQGYQDAKQFHQVITFFGDNHYLKGDWNKYQKEIYPKEYSTSTK